MQSDSSLNKQAQKLDQLLKSQVVYDYMLSLAGVTANFAACLDPYRFKRAEYDKTRPEVQNKTKESILKLQESEKKELVQMLRASPLLQQVALMNLSVACGKHIPSSKLKENLSKPILIAKRQYGGFSNRICADLIRQ